MAKVKPYIDHRVRPLNAFDQDPSRPGAIMKAKGDRSTIAEEKAKTESNPNVKPIITEPMKNKTIYIIAGIFIVLAIAAFFVGKKMTKK